MKEKIKKRDLFAVDKYNLDVEWERFPEDLRRACLDLANAKENLDRMKARLDVTEAELSLAIRRKPEEYGLEKATDKPVEAAIIVSDKYQEAQSRVIDAQHEVAILQANVTALEGKKKALENEVSLFLAGYFAKPKVRKEDEYDSRKILKKE